MIINNYTVLYMHPNVYPRLVLPTFAAGDLCITVVRALMVATARESSRPWNTWREREA